MVRVDERMAIRKRGGEHEGRRVFSCFCTVLVLAVSAAAQSRQVPTAHRTVVQTFRVIGTSGWRHPSNGRKSSPARSISRPSRRGRSSSEQPTAVVTSWLSMGQSGWTMEAAWATHPSPHLDRHRPARWPHPRADAAGANFGLLNILSQARAVGQK